MNDTSTPFPLDGGRVGVGGARTDVAMSGAEGVVDNASCAKPVEDCESTPTQPSPIEGEGYSRFGRGDRTSSRALGRARAMRATPTWTEAKLWDQLRLLPVRFRRQAPIGRYTVDFACHRASLVIEIDGGVHERPDVAVRDLERDAWFESQGYAVLRFSTRQIEDDIDGAVARIRNAASNRLKQVI